MATNEVLTVTFSEGMDEATIIPANFSLTDDLGAPIGFSVAYNPATDVATLTPDADLPTDTLITAVVETGVTDDSSKQNALAADFEWSFTTAPDADTTPPTVSATAPSPGATGVPVNTSLSVSFSEPMSESSITDLTFLLEDSGANAITGTVDYSADSQTATFTPASDLDTGEACTATITTGARDELDNALAADHTWSFTTGQTADSSAPTVTSTNPTDSATTVAVDTLITATFSEPLAPLTITGTSFTLDGPGATPVAGVASYHVNGNSVTFTPTDDLDMATLYTATLTVDITDAAGVPLANEYTWTFETGAVGDAIAPSVTSTSPANAANVVCVGKSFNATFSEAMDPSSINTATILLEDDLGAPVAGSVSYDALTNIATFNPSADLIGVPATTYTATILGGINGVTDLSGNPLAAHSVTSFTTDNEDCTEPPVLGAMEPFGGFGGSATLTNDGLETVINGDIGVFASSTSVTGLTDAGGNVYTITSDNAGIVNGLIDTLTAPRVPPRAPPSRRLTTRRSSPSTPSRRARSRAASTCRAWPSARRAAASGKAPTSWAAGRSRRAFIRPPRELTRSVPSAALRRASRSMPGAMPTPCGSSRRAPGPIGTGSTMVGTMLADASITISTAGGSPPTAPVTTLNGRAISLTAAVTMVNTVINVPSP